METKNIMDERAVMLVMECSQTITGKVVVTRPEIIKVRNQVSQPCKTTGKIIVLHSMVFTGKQKILKCSCRFLPPVGPTWGKAWDFVKQRASEMLPLPKLLFHSWLRLMYNTSTILREIASSYILISLLVHVFFYL
jgi:hypothetical protein